MPKTPKSNPKLNAAGRTAKPIAFAEVYSIRLNPELRQKINAVVEEDNLMDESHIVRMAIAFGLPIVRAGMAHMRTVSQVTASSEQIGLLFEDQKQNTARRRPGRKPKSNVTPDVSPNGKKTHAP